MSSGCMWDPLFSSVDNRLLQTEEQIFDCFFQFLFSGNLGLSRSSVLLLVPQGDKMGAVLETTKTEVQCDRSCKPRLLPALRPIKIDKKKPVLSIGLKAEYYS